MGGLITKRAGLQVFCLPFYDKSNDGRKEEFKLVLIYVVSIYILLFLLLIYLCILFVTKIL